MSRRTGSSFTFQVQSNGAETSTHASACRYLETVGRYNYTTPKSYLELIALYKDLLARKREELRASKSRLENGVEKIAQASAQVWTCICTHVIKPSLIAWVSSCHVSVM